MSWYFLFYFQTFSSITHWQLVNLGRMPHMSLSNCLPDSGLALCSNFFQIIFFSLDTIKINHMTSKKSRFLQKSKQSNHFEVFATFFENKLLECVGGQIQASDWIRDPLSISLPFFDVILLLKTKKKCKLHYFQRKHWFSRKRN